MKILEGYKQNISLDHEIHMLSNDQSYEQWQNIMKS
jgi:hypothetical protein